MEKLPIVICWYQFPLCVCHEPQGESFQLITILCLISSLSRIKRYRQEKAIGSREEKKIIREGNGEKLRKMQQRNSEERWRTRSVCVCDQEEEKSHFEKFIEADFYDEWSCVGFDSRGSKGDMCHGGRQRLFKACQLGSILSHSYLVCLDRHSTKGERRKRQHGHNWHVEWMAQNYSGQWRFILPFLDCQRLQGADCHSVTQSYCGGFAVVFHTVFKIKWKISQWTWTGPPVCCAVADVFKWLLLRQKRLKHITLWQPMDGWCCAKGGKGELCWDVCMENEFVWWHCSESSTNSLTWTSCKTHIHIYTWRMFTYTSEALCLQGVLRGPYRNTLEKRKLLFKTQTKQ